MDSKQDQFFRAVASRRIPRIRVAGVVIDGASTLVQQPTDDPASCYAFIGGEYEVGDTFETRLRREFEEETNARIVECRYLFCVENYFRYKDDLIQQAEHFFLVKLDRRDVISREAHLKQSWLPLSDLPNIDLRPHVVRTSLVTGTYLTDRYLRQEPT
jgi:ADP-ribose pyrophosphatase YjhB (NUDIX family)